jgi:hypothetical protein
MLEMELTLTQHILIYMLVILLLIKMATQAIMEPIQDMVMKAILIDKHTANLQRDLEVILYWSNLTKKSQIKHRMLKKMDIRLKILLSHTFQKKRVKFPKKNGIQLQKKAIWKHKKRDLREEIDMIKNASSKMLKIDFILIIKTSQLLYNYYI